MKKKQTASKGKVKAVNKKAVNKKALGSRNNSGKPRLSLVLEAKNALAGAAVILEQGLKEYGRANWRKGLPLTEICDSMTRHLADFLSGETLDSASGRPHVDHVLCNALFLAEISKTNPELDDRPVVEGIEQ